MNTNDHASAVADMQRRGLQGALALGRATTGMFERLARQNYAVMGDVVDYTLTQLRIPTVHADARSALEAQAAGTRAAVEKARVRATEYAAIAGEMRDVAGSAASATAASAATVSTKPGPTSGVESAPATSPTAPDTGTRAAGGSPIIVPGDSPKAVARKSIRAADAVAVEAEATRTVVKADAKRAGKTAAEGTAKAASKRTAAKAAAKKPAAKQATAGKTAKKTASKAGAKKRPTPARGTRVKKG